MANILLSSNKLCIRLEQGHHCDISYHDGPPHLGLFIQMETMGGVNETLVKELHVTPRLFPPLAVVTTTTKMPHLI